MAKIFVFFLILMVTLATQSCYDPQHLICLSTNHQYKTSMAECDVSNQFMNSNNGSQSTQYENTCSQCFSRFQLWNDSFNDCSNQQCAVYYEHKKFKKTLKIKITQLFPFCDISEQNIASFLKINLKSSDLASKLHIRLLFQNINIEKNSASTIQIKSILNQYQLITILSSFEQVKNEIYKPLVPFSIDQNVIYGVLRINTDQLFQHEHYIKDRQINLKNYLEKHDNAVLPSILICSKSLLVIDGHHRLSIYKQKGVKQIPVLLVNYENENILTHPEKNVSKKEIVARAYQRSLYPPKSTKHMIVDLIGESRPLSSISVAIDEKNQIHLNENFDEYVKRLQISSKIQEGSSSELSIYNASYNLVLKYLNLMISEISIALEQL